MDRSLASTEQIGRCLEACITLLRLSRHFEHEPTLIGYLSSIACRGIAVEAANRVLRSGPVSNESRQTLDEELAKYDAAAGYRRALVSERAFGLDHFRSFTFMDWWIARARWNPEKSEYLDLLGRYIAEADQPFYTLPASDDGVSSRYVFSALIAPALEAARVATERSRALTQRFACSTPSSGGPIPTGCPRTTCRTSDCPRTP